MSSIPLPALDIRPTQQQDPIESYSRVLQLRNILQEAPLRQQLLQQQVQEGQQNQAARQALNQVYAGAVTKDENGNPTIDPNKLAQGLANGPAAYKTPEVMKGITDFQKSRLELQTTATDLQTKQADMIGAAAAAVKAANYDPTLAHSLLDTLPQSPQLNQIRAQIDNPQTLRQMIDSAIKNSSKQREIGASEQTAGARQLTAQTEQQRLQAQMDPNSSLYAPSQASVAMGTAPGAAQIQAGEAKLAGQKSAAEAAARQPFELSLARARQAIQDGDPRSAAQLLISGDVAPSQIISARKPEFAQQAFQAAHEMSGGKWNAQSAEANFKVASSPANVAFFGSAKSLTDKGGTLDQLAEAAKDIPAHQIPALNSFDDWVKAATGSGPMAKYASIALGSADDYSKVMGGGVGSDTSRQKALDLFKANLSPGGKAGAIEGVRGAVNSQINGRIGKNPVLQRMFGSDESGGGTVTLRAPNGQLKDVPADQVDHYLSLGAKKVAQ